MRRLKRYLPVLLVVAFVLGIFGYIKVRAVQYDYEVAYTDTGEDGTAYGADIGFSKLYGEDNEPTGEVEASIKKFYSGEDVNIPATVSFGGITYSVVSLDLNRQNYS
ncbi:MAG: hypothetical protein K5858_11455, partial [Lachnospiraceae bacterium]|nr:hypothetical protein [Lachnospiraceae bacterium]